MLLLKIINIKGSGVITKLGKKYDQDSVLYKPPDETDAYILGTSSGAWSGLGNVEKVGKWTPNKIGEFYTKWKGRNFVFESISEPMTISEIRAEKLKNL